ncbi:MAG: SMC family ATPase, partial [Candidatus Hydrothermae bacterium]|nr:SMC family ATPase [Candidatus Hydrothermae bacterium]
MKLLKLELENFIAYPGRETVDFEALRQVHPLLLISGPTGSGKSTLMDALRFVLYGRNRSEREPASAFHKQGGPSHVTLEFQVGGDVYRLHRSWSGKQQRMWVLERQVNGTWEALPQHALSELLPMNQNLFQQVVVLPQGKYVEWIRMPSRQRYDQIGQILPMDWVKRLEQNLQHQYDTLQQQMGELRSTAAGLLGLETPPETLSDLESAGKEREDTLKRTRNAREELNKKLKQERKKKTIQDRRLQAVQDVERRVETWIKLMHRAQALFTEQTEVERLKKELARLSEYQARFADLWPALERDRRSLDHVQKERKKLGKTQKEVQETLSRLEAQEEEIQKHRLERDQLQVDLERWKELTTRLTGLGRKVRRLREKTQELDARRAQLAQAAGWLTLREQLMLTLEQRKREEERNRLQKQMQATRAKLDKKEEALQALGERYREALLSELVEELREGEPCPLCGRPHHPHPFVPGEHTGALQTLERKRKDLNRQVGKLREELGKLQEKLTQVQEALEQHASEVPDLEHLTQTAA